MKSQEVEHYPNLLNVCRHCNDVIPVGDEAVRYSSWWLICHKCVMGSVRIQIVQGQDGPLIGEIDSYEHLKQTCKHNH
jgi:ribosomal protein L40E